MHQIIRAGTPFGELLGRFPDSRLLLSGTAVPTAYHDDLQALLDQCGRVDGKERPDMEVVLQAVNGVLQKVNDVPSNSGQGGFGLPTAADDEKTLIRFTRSRTPVAHADDEAQICIICNRLRGVLSVEVAIFPLTPLLLLEHDRAPTAPAPAPSAEAGTSSLELPYLASLNLGGNDSRGKWRRGGYDVLAHPWLGQQ